MKLTDFLMSEQAEPTNKSDIRLIMFTKMKNKANPDDQYKITSAFIDRCKANNMEYYVTYIDSCYFEEDANGVGRIYNLGDTEGFEVNSNTVVMSRNAGGYTLSMDILSQLENRGLFMINPRHCIESCNDKYLAYLLMCDNDIPSPRTVMVSGDTPLDIAFKKIGGKFPVVLKTITGSKGVGVFLAESWEGLKSTLQAFWKLNSSEIIMQEYLNSQYDIRIHVLGGKVIGAMKRLRIKEDFRSNFSLGGEVGKIVLTDEQKQIAKSAAKAVGAVWCGVDMIESGGKNYIIEINSSPGTKGIEKATGKSITDKVFNYITDKEKWIRPTTEVGYIENISIEGFGKLKAKFDTGNGGHCVIHTDKVDTDGTTIKWTHGGKDYTHNHLGNKNMKIRGVLDKYDERPVVSLDVTFNGTTYTDVKFSLTNRSNMSTPVLMNREFIKRAHLSINPQKRYAVVFREATKLHDALDGLAPLNEEIADLELKILEGSVSSDQKSHYISVIRDLKEGLNGIESPKVAMLYDKYKRLEKMIGAVK